MSLLPVGIGSEEGGYQIERSLRFNSADSAYLNRTPASAGNRKTWTWSGWVKRGSMSSAQNIFSARGATEATLCRLESGDTFLFFARNASSTTLAQYSSAAVFRDPSSYYHVIIVVDTTQATAANRVLLYVNGVSQTLTASTTVAQNTDLFINQNIAHGIGIQPNVGEYLDGYLTEINFIDGQALTPTSFGEFNSDTGVWQPKKYTGTYGTNGFYLNFKDNASTSALGTDYSGNSNTWTTNNFSVTAGAGNDSLVDSPTRYGTDTGAGGEVRGNYCTWNPLDKDDGITSVTQGNLTVVTNGSNGSIKSTIAFPSGKWYWEVTSDSVNAGGTQAIGIIPQSQPPTNNMSDSGKLGYAIDASNSDRKFDNGTATNYGSYTQGNGVIYMLAFDQSAGKLWYGVGGTWLASGDPATDSNPSSSGISTSTAYCAAVSDNTLSGTFTANFGQRPFAYTAPSGFKALVTTNLPTPTIEDGGEYFNTVLWTGNGSTTQSVSGVGFQPDFVWIKGRSIAAWNRLQNTVAGINKLLYSNSTNSEATDEANGYVSAVTSDGFTLADPGANGGGVNALNETYVAWNWKANGAGVSNTDGTITSTVSANTTSGFSIVRFTGTDAVATVGHGLGAVPKFMILKGTQRSDWWGVYHVSLGNTKYLQLNTTSAEGTSSTLWNNTTPTSTVFTLADQSAINPNGELSIAYVFAEVPGYSAFGSYTGNGSADGPFVFTGFRPAFVLQKRSDGGTVDWQIKDTTRDPYNAATKRLWPNLSDAEGSGADLDILSNGFKIRESGAATNTSGGTYIYAAFAENPFSIALAR